MAAQGDARVQGPTLVRFGTPYVSSLTQAPITFASAATLTGISGVSAQIYKVYRLFLVAAGITTITFQDNTTALSGAISMQSGVPLCLAFEAEPWYTGSASGTAFNIVNSGATQISGTIYYVQN